MIESLFDTLVFSVRVAILVAAGVGVLWWLIGVAFGNRGARY